MNRFKRLSALALTLVVGLAACDDGTGPDADGPFNPTASAADIQVVQSAFDTPVFASLGSMSGRFSQINGAPALASTLLDAGWDLATAGESWQLQEAGNRVAGALYSTSAAALLIPESFRGRTYVHQPEEGYYFDEARTGAPANGMRFILYEVNPVTGEPGLTEIGYVDILDESTDAALVARLVVVSGQTEFMNYTVSASGLLGSISFGVSGFITDGTDQVDLDLTSSFSSTFASERVEIAYSIGVPTRDFNMTASLVMEFERETDLGSMTINVQFSERSNTVQFQGSFSLSEQESGTLNVLVNGQLFATITIEADAMVIAGPNGETLSAEQAQALGTMMDGLEGLFDDTFEDFVRPVSWLFQFST